jgi:hypothetical protein
MHAVVINVSFKDSAAAQGELSALVPRVSAMPGFVAGYWIALPRDRGTSTVVFDSEDSAQALVRMVGTAPAETVTVESAEVGEVMAHV